LRRGAPGGGEDGPPGRGEGKDGWGQADDAPEIGEV